MPRQKVSVLRPSEAAESLIAGSPLLLIDTKEQLAKLLAGTSRPNSLRYLGNLGTGQRKKAVDCFFFIKSLHRSIRSN